MFKAQFLKDLAAQLSDSLPNHLQSFKKDFDQHCERVLASTFTKLDLVTREEFDVQTKVLARTRQKLEALEKEVQRLETIIEQLSNTHE